MLFWLSEVVARLGADPLLQGALAAAGTLVLEDPTTIGCGLLVADGRMAFGTALAGVAAGIALGDIGLYALGRFVGAKALRWGWLPAPRLDRAAHWFERNLVATVILSRFVPGMRLPTYLGAGVLQAPARRFATVAVCASLVWTLLLLGATVSLGGPLLPLLGRARWPLALAAVALLVLVQRRAARKLAVVDATASRGERVASLFEFWPPWLFYLPVAAYWLWLSVRHRGATLPTAANPSIFSGGLIGESKSAILDLVPGLHRRWLAPYVVFARPGAERPAGELLADAQRAIACAGLDYPLVAKPDVGQRGAGVRPIRREQDLADYLREFPPGERILFQRLAGTREAEADEVREAGVLYWRAPGSSHGSIFSITLKQIPRLVGDGQHTVRELIEADPRARRISRVYLRRHAADAGRVLARGESLPLVFAGNHCQGAIFRDGTALATAALGERVHEIADAMPEFYFGRFDVRFDDLAAFLRGEDFQVIEINGAGAEATHIWDASAGLADAYATLFEQLRILFAIGAANRRRGHRPLGLARLLREVVGYRRLARTYPLTH